MARRKWNKKQKAGSKGGDTTVAKYGREYMARIGRDGGLRTKQLYYYQPAGTAGWFMRRREDDELIATVNIPRRQEP